MTKISRSYSPHLAVCLKKKIKMVMMMMRRRMINIIKATGDFYMVSYAAILHIVMHHSSLEESIVRSLTQRTAVWETNFHIALNTNSIL